MSVTWFVIRASGLVAFVMLTLSVGWGLLVSTGILGRNPSKKMLTYAHEGLAVASILATVTHLGFLAVDRFVPFSIPELLVPGLATWQPVATAMGVVAMWLVVVVSGSFYVRARIGRNAWKAIHYLSFGAFAAAAYHGIAAGTDTMSPMVLTMYGSAISMVVGLTVWRIASECGRPEPKRHSGAAQPRRSVDAGVAAAAHGRPDGDVEAEARRLAAADAPTG